MTLELALSDGALVVRDADRQLRGKHAAQLNFWQFRYDRDAKAYRARVADVAPVAQKVIDYFASQHVPIEVKPEVTAACSRATAEQSELSEAIAFGRKIKDGEITNDRVRSFVEFAARKLARPLKQHQLKASVHLLAITNGANFSVPGSGKTSVVLAVFQFLKERGEVDQLLVVGPPSCFGPWREEYAAVIGRKPHVSILAGGDVENRWRTYKDPPRADIYLTTYQTLCNDQQRVAEWLTRIGEETFLVLDEAHYIKQEGGIWAQAVLSLASLTRHRCVLTGTPFPRVYSDAFNLFDALWPARSPISEADRIRIELHSKRDETDQATAILERTIGPLFYRVRKRELGLAPQIFHDPVVIDMRPYEKTAYDEIVARVRSASKQDRLHDIDLVLRLRRGRMMRLRQSVSYAKLLATAVSEYPEDLLEGELSLTDILTHYDDLERPAKLDALCDLVRELRNRGEKIVVWSNFIATLHLIRDALGKIGNRVQMIFGDTPTERETLSTELTREKIIADFTSPNGETDILVANPAACAESISLHKTCAHAIYYDLSYNCAQYLQSLDRIHRVGGSEDRPAHYHFLQYADTIDADILDNVLTKARRMSAVIDREYPIYSLDMFTIDEELEAYQRLFV
jgi:SNF2 family DNA or RNA helicase